MQLRKLLSATVFVSLALIANDCIAQTPSVRAVTFSYVKHGVILGTVDSTAFFYSNNRGGVGKPVELDEVNGVYGTELLYGTQFLYDSAKFIPLRKQNYYQLYEKSYDINNNIIDVTEIRVDNSVRTNNEKRIYTYNTNNSLTSITIQNWKNSSWRDYRKDTILYDNNNRVIADTIYENTLYQQASGTNWDYRECLLSSYNAQGKLKQFEHHAYSGSNPSWSHYRTTKYIYDQNQLLDSAVEYRGASMTVYSIELYQHGASQMSKEVLKPGSGSLQHSFQNYTYNTVGQVLTEEYSYWDKNKNIYMPSSREVNSYNTNNTDLLTKQLMYWDTGTAAFEPGVRRLYVYNSNNQFTHRDIQTWDKATQAWVYIADTTYVYYYGTNLNDVQEQTPPAISLNMYPNPASGFLNIDINIQQAQEVIIAVYDIQGRLVSQVGVAGRTEQFSRQVPLAGLSAGTYLLQVKASGEVVTKQFVVSGQ